jgi:uncharacterized protein YktB (UPF0637 family)
MLIFLKEAFCIVGEVLKHKELVIDEMPSVMFKLTDVKRGEFYVTISISKK